MKKLIPVLSESEKKEIIAYFTVYEKYADEFSKQATEELKEHPIFGKLIKDTPKEVSEASNKISKKLQKDAIINNNWLPYIEYQVEQGIIYAKMGLDFRSWYEVVGLAKKYIRPYLVKEYGTTPELLSSLNGMNRFMDIAMGIIGEAYMREKEGIIREEQDKIKKLNEELEQKVIERTAELKEFQHFFNNNNDLCGIANTEGHFEIINTNFSKVLGYSEKEFCEMPFIDLIYPDDVPSTLHEYDKLKAGALVINFVNRYRKSDGSYLYLDWNATPNTETGKLYCVARDITERKKTEEALMKSLKEISDYKFALNESSIVTITDHKGIIKFANNNFCKISKYTNDEVIGKDHRIINSGFHPKEFMRDMWTTMLNGLIWRGEIKNKAKDGTYYWVDTTIVPFINEQGKPFQYAAIRTDITERKKAEEQLQASNKELEAFTYSVSHDLRAPLRHIHGYSKILEEDYFKDLDEKGKKTINSIMRNAKQMGDLIDDLLAFSRLGRKELSTSLLDMDTIVKSVCNDFISKDSKINVELKINKLPPSYGDYVLIKQVWVNLISNALKFSLMKPTVILEIGATEKEGINEYYIKDNGAGFDMRFYNKLFGVFQRLHSQEEFEGTGVGLAIVKRIIKKHNGKIWAESKLNEGACFYFTIPIDKPKN